MKKLEQKEVFNNGWWKVLQTFWKKGEKIGNVLIMKKAKSEKWDSVFVLPITKTGKVLYMKEFKFWPEEYQFCIPAGADDFDNPEKSALKELQEETWYSSKKLINLWYFNQNNYIVGKMHIFLSLDCEKNQQQNTVDIEDIKIFEANIDDFEKMINENTIKCPWTNIAFLKTKKLTNNFTNFNF